MERSGRGLMATLSLHLSRRTGGKSRKTSIIIACSMAEIGMEHFLIVNQKNFDNFARCVSK
jgi:hypothetical protein